MKNQYPTWRAHFGAPGWPLRHTDTQTDRQTDKQTDRQAGRQTDRQADRQTDRHTHTQTHRQTDTKTYRCMPSHSYTDRWIFNALFDTCHFTMFALLTPFLKVNFIVILQCGSVTHQMAVPVPSISCCVLNHHNLFYHIQNALAFNRDMCCHLAICLRVLPFH